MNKFNKGSVVISKRGFTLIELLIVIAIISILAVAVILVLNPAQILAESRDTTRISDLRAVQSAIGLYLATVGSPGLGGPNNSVCSLAGLSSWRSAVAQIADGQPFGAPNVATSSASFGRAIDGNGWIAVDLGKIPGGSPLGTLPVDPATSPATAGAGNGLDGAARYYAYQCSGTTYEINANMESTKFSKNGTSDVESNDGGVIGCSGTGASSTRCDGTKASFIYEVGTDPGLDY